MWNALVRPANIWRIVSFARAIAVSTGGTPSAVRSAAPASEWWFIRLDHTTVEEDCLRGRCGSGTIFFSWCSLLA
jgi:hypothetical protein